MPVQVEKEEPNYPGSAFCNVLMMSRCQIFMGDSYAELEKPS